MSLLNGTILIAYTLNPLKVVDVGAADVAVAELPSPVIVTVGVEVYPLPGLVTSIADTAPPLIVAFAFAP